MWCACAAGWGEADAVRNNSSAIGDSAKREAATDARGSDNTDQ
jgi:hypothetical protein